MHLSHPHHSLAPYTSTRTAQTPALSPILALALQEYLNAYGTEGERRLGREVIAKESNVGLSRWARDKLERYMERLDAGEKDLYF